MSIVKKYSAEFRNIIYNLSEKIIILILNFIVISFLIRNSTKHDWGTFSIALALLAIIEAFSTLGLDQIFIKRIKTSLRPEKHIMAVISLKITASIFLIILTNLIILSLGQYLDFNETISLYLVLMTFQIPFRNLVLSLDAYLLSRLKTKILVNIKIFNVALFSLIKILYFNSYGDLLGIVIISVLEIAILSILCYAKFKSYEKLIPIKFEFFDTVIIKDYFIASVPLMLVAILSMTFTRIDQIMMSFLLSSIKVAEYAVTIRVLDIISMLHVTFFASFFPKIVSLVHDKHCDYSELRKIYRISFIIGIFVLLVLFLFSDKLFLIAFGSNYLISSHYLIYLSPFILLSIIQNINVNLLYARELLHHLWKITLEAGCINICLNILLIPKFGAIGAIVATNLSMVYIALFRDYFHQDLRYIINARFGCSS